MARNEVIQSYALAYPPAKGLLVYSSADANTRAGFVDGESEESMWVARARAGEESAQLWLLDRYRNRVLRLATHILRRSDEAEDAAQEAMIRALTNLKKYRGDAPFSAWLLRIVARTCIDHARRRAGRREVPLEDDLIAGVAAPGRGADTRLLVSALLDGLTPLLRAALVLRELEGLSYEEISAALDIPVGTVRSRLSAARTRFRELYESAEKESNDV